MKKTSRVLLIYTDNTIGTGQSIKTGVLKPFDFHRLVGNVPEFKLIQTNVGVYQFILPIDLSDMTPTMQAKLVTIINECCERHDGFVILRGTGTTVYTAPVLSFMPEDLIKPVMLTDSQLPIGVLRVDGRGSLIPSIELASAHRRDGMTIISEMCIYFNGRLSRGNRSTKQNADGFSTFDSFSFPHLCDTGANLTYHEHLILKPSSKKPIVPYTHLNSHIMALSLLPGLQGDIMQQTLEVPSLRGIVIHNYGSGDASQTPWLTRLFSQTAERGVTIANVSQYVWGDVEMPRYDNRYQLRNAGVVSGYGDTIEVALVKLMFLQARYDDYATICQRMKQLITGEITPPPSVTMNWSLILLTQA